MRCDCGAAAASLARRLRGVLVKKNFSCGFDFVVSSAKTSGFFISADFAGIPL